MASGCVGKQNAHTSIGFCTGGQSGGRDLMVLQKEAIQLTATVTLLSTDIEGPTRWLQHSAMGEWSPARRDPVQEI